MTYNIEDEGEYRLFTGDVIRATRIERHVTSNFRATFNTRRGHQFVFLLLGFAKTTEDHVDANRMLEDMGWTKKKDESATTDIRRSGEVKCKCGKRAHFIIHGRAYCHNCKRKEHR